jgi:[ribosomal protein S5]-alanine N-acetyltransferase
MPSHRTSLGATLHARGLRVYLRAPRAADAQAFIAAVKASRKLHGAWVKPPSTTSRFAEFVRRNGALTRRDPIALTHAALLVCRSSDDAIVGVFHLSEIVRGAFQSAYLGYYGFAPHTGEGYMSEGLALALAWAFRRLRLHRVEANVQPTNRRSLALVGRAGFVREGYSRKYLKVDGRWRDHVRLALTVEDWQTQRRAAR